MQINYIGSKKYIQMFKLIYNNTNNKINNMIKNNI